MTVNRQWKFPDGARCTRHVLSLVGADRVNRVIRQPERRGFDCLAAKTREAEDHPEDRMASAEQPPTSGRAEVRIVAASPEVARAIADVLRRCFAATEQRSYPAGNEGGTRLHLTVDTTHPAALAQSWLLASQSSEDDRPQPDEV